MRRVLVTGATGFVGRHTLEPLRARGFEVHAVARTPGTEAGVAHHACDLFDPTATRRLLEEVTPTHLLHLAWYAVPRAYWTSEENLRWIEASLALARAFRAVGGRRITVAGTCAEYDWRRSECSELDPVAPGTLYGTSKHALQRVLTAWGDQTGLGVAWGRLFFLFGAHEPSDRLLPSLITAGVRRAPLACTDGAQHRDFQHVSDAAGALVALLDTEVTGVVNIASGTTRPVRDVIGAVADRLQAHDLFQLGTVARAASDPPMLRADTRRLREEVGWRDQLTFDDALDATIAWWRARLAS